jgi:hypothetical protein
MKLVEKLDGFEQFRPRTDCQIIGTALAIGLGIASVAGGVASAAIGSSAAGHAADTQAAAIDRSAQLQKQAADESLAFQKQEYADQQKNLAPWLKAGTSAIDTLSGDLQNGGYPDWTGHFTAPTAATEQNDPGYAFRLAEGNKAIERAKSASGDLLSGGTAKALTRYGEDYATSAYNDVYNRAMQQYKLGYDEFQANNTNKFNRYASIAGVGQQTATTLGQEGQAAATNVSNTLTTSASNIGNDYQNAAAARASGYINSANAYGGAISNGINTGMSLATLLALQGKGKH